MNDLVIYTSFENYGLKAKYNSLSLLIDKGSTIEVLEDKELWNDERQQRLMTFMELTRATKAWNKLRETPLIKLLTNSNFEFFYSNVNKDYVMSELQRCANSKVSAFYLENGFDSESSLPFSYEIDNVILDCCIYVNGDRVICLSDHVDITITDDESLDYSYENVSMRDKRTILIYGKYSR